MIESIEELGRLPCADGDSNYLSSQTPNEKGGRQGEDVDSNDISPGINEELFLRNPSAHMQGDYLDNFLETKARADCDYRLSPRSNITLN